MVREQVGARPPRSEGEGRLLRDAAARSIEYLRSLEGRRVFPSDATLRDLERLSARLPDGPTSPEEVVALLDRYGSPATVASNGGRYFGFVVGSALPAALAAHWLAGAWNQNAALNVLSPVALHLERTALGWVREVLGLPEGTTGAFVSGSSIANLTALAAARHAVLSQIGYDVESRGMAGAPEVSVVVSEEAHVTVVKALALLGFGRDRLVRAPVDDQGRVQADLFPRLRAPAIVCLQAGNVNSGSFDPLAEIIPRVKAEGAWVHVDGAFGLWAAAWEGRKHLLNGAHLADSWGVDGHKWLNVPYDSGIVLVREPRHLRAAMASGPAAYLDSGGVPEPWHLAPELSRRARGVEAWAALMSLGREGLRDLVEGCCRCAEVFARELERAGYEVLNKVVLNQVLVSFGDDATTERVIAALQAEGTCWCGGTRWHGKAAMRISVSSWATTEEDVERSVRAMLRVASEVRGGARVGVMGGADDRCLNDYQELNLGGLRTSHVRE